MSKKNVFSGVDDVYLTKNSIAVRKVSGKFDNKGNYSYNDNTKYYPKTKENMNMARSVHGKIRIGRNK